MRRPHFRRQSRIERGCVVSGPNGLLAVVIGVHGESLELCKILHRPRHHHRADVKLGLGDCIMLGVMSGNVVRCRPFMMARRYFRLRADTVSADLLQAVRIGVERETLLTRWERLERRSGGVSSVYG